MKRRDLVRHLKKQGCRQSREGGRHTVFTNPTTGRSSSIPRHRELNEFLVKKICKDLDVPAP